MEHIKELRKSPGLLLVIFRLFGNLENFIFLTKLDIVLSDKFLEGKPGFARYALQWILLYINAVHTQKNRIFFLSI